MEISCVKEVEQNPLPKSQTKPFYIGTKEAPSVLRVVAINSELNMKQRTSGHVNAHLKSGIFTNKLN